MNYHKIVKHWVAVVFSLLVNMFLLFQVQAGGIYDPSFPYTDGNYTAQPTTDIGQVLKQSNQGGSFLENMLDVFQINYTGPDKAISYVQVLINYILALVGFIAILFIIYSFYMIFFGKSEDAIAKARKTVVGASIAIVVIAASAYIVNLLFYLYSRGI